MTTKDENDDFVFSFGSERDFDAAEKIMELMDQSWFMNHHKLANNDDVYYTQLFEQGHCLFFWMRLDEITNMRASDTDFGILPIPKYDEAQQEYYSQVSRYITGLLSIPITLSGDSLGEVGMIVEAMSADSHYTLIPEYIETSLKTKNSRDAESGDMLEIIINNRVFDPMHIYNFGGWHDTFLYLSKADGSNLASLLKSKEKLVNKNIENFNRDIRSSE